MGQNRQIWFDLDKNLNYVTRVSQPVFDRPKMHWNRARQGGSCEEEIDRNLKFVESRESRDWADAGRAAGRDLARR